MFSSPAPLGLGDDTYDAKERRINKNNNWQIAKRDATTGKVVIEAANIKVAHGKSGKIKSSYFSQLGFTTIGRELKKNI